MDIQAKSPNQWAIAMAIFEFTTVSSESTTSKQDWRIGKKGIKKTITTAMCVCVCKRLFTCCRQRKVGSAQEPYSDRWTTRTVYTYAMWNCIALRFTIRISFSGFWNIFRIDFFRCWNFLIHASYRISIKCFLFFGFWVVHRKCRFCFDFNILFRLDDRLSSNSAIKNPVQKHFASSWRFVQRWQKEWNKCTNVIEKTPGCMSGHFNNATRCWNCTTPKLIWTLRCQKWHHQQRERKKREQNTTNE